MKNKNWEIRSINKIIFYRGGAAADPNTTLRKSWNLDFYQSVSKIFPHMTWCSKYLSIFSLFHILQEKVQLSHTNETFHFVSTVQNEEKSKD